MRKIRNQTAFWVLILLSVFLAGCGSGGSSGGGDDEGGGNGGGNEVPTNLIGFTMPEYYLYYDQSEYEYFGCAIPSGLVVKLYILTETAYNNLGEEGLSADHIFTGTIGDSILSFALPDSLVNQDRYIFASLSDSSDFSFQGMTGSEIDKTVSEGKALKGGVIIDNDLALITLTNGAIINNLQFIGIASLGNPVNLINFSIPGAYAIYGGDGAVRDIPGGKDITFYTVDETAHSQFQAGGEATFETDDDTFSGKTGTGGGALLFELPESLKRQDRYVYAVVNLRGDFDLRGKTNTQVETAIINGEVLVGRSLKPDPEDNYDYKLYSLTEGKNDIANFKFLGVDL